MKRLRWVQRVVLAAWVMLGQQRAGLAQTESASVPAFERYELSNGLDVVLAPDARGAEVGVVVRYAVGHAHDPAAYPGLAHLLEHATFRGSSHLKPLEAMSILGELGAGYHALTGLEQTDYVTTVQRAGLETVLWLESERMGFALGGIDVAGLRAEQRVVKRELRQRSGALSHQLSTLWRGALYGERHPFRPADDESDAVEAVELAGLQWFFQSTYRPDNATLVLVGGFESALARGLVEKYFGPLRNPKLARLHVEAAPPKLCGTHRVTISHRGLFGRELWFTWPGPPSGTAVAQQRMDGLAKALQDRLDAALIERGTDVSSVSVAPTFFRTHSLFSVKLQLHESGRWDAAEAAVLGEARRLVTTPISEVQLRTVRASLVSDQAFSRSGGLGRAFDLVEGVDRARLAMTSLSAEELRVAAQVLSGPRLILTAEPGGRWARETQVTGSVNPCP